MLGEKPKTYCDKENGCMFCELLLCDGSRKRQTQKAERLMSHGQMGKNDGRTKEKLL